MQKVLDTVMGKSGFETADVPDLAGRTAVVTGGTEGIGFEVARALALSNARVLLLARKADSGEEAIRKIKDSDNPNADVVFMSCDLGNLQNVKEVADTIAKQEERLDLLIADAGVGVNKFDVSADGIDRHFSVNVLGHFLLINRLYPLIRRTSTIPGAPKPRIVQVSSDLHRAAPSSIKFASVEELEEKASQELTMTAVALYARSKLAMILLTKYGLVERVIQPNNDNILALATHPGAVATGQQDQFKECYGQVFGTMLKHMVVPFMRNPEQGSLSTLWAATSDEVEKNGWQGKYFTDPGQLGGESSQACDAELGKNVWELNEKLVKEKLGPDGLIPWGKEAEVKPEEQMAQAKGFNEPEPVLA
ncbi:NAD(P)-binding protein [Neolentinus lepideus HHB14362 ss-1]|uniref:NAD(P)-binding protein n=1 Tax=Neolentinus lepideus HHB14362 ss-1 TaxID=1314782 RepID=A0A165TL49_9AGAM|nr:NAD(P)-binding protein [Neolentinus lepideus HHB14362 ss-1]